MFHGTARSLFERSHDDTYTRFVCRSYYATFLVYAFCRVFVIQSPRTFFTGPVNTYERFVRVPYIDIVESSHSLPFGLLFPPFRQTPFIVEIFSETSPPVIGIIRTIFVRNQRRDVSDLSINNGRPMGVHFDRSSIFRSRVRGSVEKTFRKFRTRQTTLLRSRRLRFCPLARLNGRRVTVAAADTERPITSTPMQRFDVLIVPVYPAVKLRR